MKCPITKMLTENAMPIVDRPACTDLRLNCRTIMRIGTGIERALTSDSTSDRR